MCRLPGGAAAASHGAQHEPGGNPYDNALCESFLKTLKQEEICANDYRDLEHVEANVEIFIEQYYNRRRLHSALNYRSPEEFERREQEKAGWEGGLPRVAKIRFSAPPERGDAGAGGVG